MSVNRQAMPGSVLLTGATGSLGGQLCAELLLATTTTVYCLVRATDRATAAARLSRRLEQLDERPHTGPRLIAIAGDMENANLGMPAREYDALAETVDAVIHCAAHVNLAANYEQLAPANLGATRNLIAFAQHRAHLTGHVAAFHYVSTLGTFASACKMGLDQVDESTDVSLATAGQLGYPQSKAAAEIELRGAAAAGLPVTVFRPGVVTGHSRTGQTSSSDVLTPLLEAAVALGLAPIGTGVVPAERVDIVARGLVALIRRGGCAGRTFHLVQREPLRLADLFDALRRAGHRLEPVELDRWWQKIEQHRDDPAVLPLAAMSEVGRYMLGGDSAHRSPRFMSEATWAALAEAGVDAEPFDGTFFDRLIAGLSLPRPLRGSDSVRPAAPEAVVYRGSGSTPGQPKSPADTNKVRIDGLIAPPAFANDGRFPDAAGAAAACESAGYGAFWAQEQHHDPLLALAAAAGRTTSIELGTAVLVALARTPMTVAYSAHDLHAQCGGRLILGLGPQIKAHLDNRFSMPSDRRIARMREFVAALKAIWDCWNYGRPLQFRGEFYTHTLMIPFFTPPPNPYGSPRVFLAATGPPMAELAGEVADGLIAPPYANPRYLSEVLLPALDRGLAKSGRARDTFTVVCIPLVVTGRTAIEHARVDARIRSMIALWCSTRASRLVFAPYGLSALGERLIDLSLSDLPDRWQRMADLIDDKTLDIFATVAAPEHLGSELRRRFGGLVDRIVLPAPHGPEAGLWDPARLRLADVDPKLQTRIHS